MQYDSTDKRVLVTVGTRGIGLAIIEAFLSAGARVAVNGRTEQPVSTSVAKMGVNDRLFAAPGDISTVSGCEPAVSTAVESLCGLDVLVNSAGVGKDLSIEDGDEAIWGSNLAAILHLIPLRTHCRDWSYAS